MSAVSFDLAGAADASGLSVRTLQLAIADGSLIAHYSGRKPIIAAADLAAFVEALPTERVS